MGIGRLIDVKVELQGFYNLAMAPTKTPAQIKADYVGLMVRRQVKRLQN